MKIVILGDPRTKKNSLRAFNGRVLPSKAYSDYARTALPQLTRLQADMIRTPVNVRCVYFMQTRRKVDLVNLLEGTLDLLVGAGILEDDNSRIVAGMDGSRVAYDKANPRVEIEIGDADNAEPREP